MENAIRIKTANTDEWITAVLANQRKILCELHDHKGEDSIYIVSTESIQSLFELGQTYGIALANAGKGNNPYLQPNSNITRGKGNEKKHPDEVGRKALAKVSRK